ncbi:L-threonylcarbamoyladenylate synthase [Pseudaquabacterium pictum]|uniref:Threonylcarbamoyl-AMP synthase n=1 Tax=Pseudaquabacterium pictum TaxID=2315236 RepID=A0A480AUY6_9BURK|nr:L-threonylcarbamoyladenylate synthase [Rubrivivax pictus]GCL63947.1 threonylcarbamoyl-AMP synthase [Rubrivivax pictus]
MPILAGDDPAALAAAAQCLAAGGLVGLPTETVYGLAARADDDAAVAGIFTAKGRPADHPLIVHVADLVQAAAFTDALPPAAQRLAAAFWPGPVTVIVPRRPGVAAAAAGGQSSIGLRCPSHPVAQALLRQAAALGVPGVAAPSANRFGRVSPTSAAHVAGEFGPGLLVLDGGDCPVGIESAIVDCSRGHPVLLRPGLLTRAALRAALGEPLHDADAGAPRAPGTLAAHYAPRARLRLWPPADLAAALDKPATWPPGLAVYSRRPVAAPGRCLWRPWPDDPAAAAHDLFAALRQLDDDGATEIWVEQPPDTPAWEGVLDRLRRAASA